MRGRISCGKGFTLVGLLIVVAIIAILASLLLPALSNAKAKGQSARCKGNLRQIHLTYGMAVEDNDDKFGFDGEGGPIDEFWSTKHGVGGEWICPTAPIRNNPANGTVSSAWAWNRDKTIVAGSYTFNGFFGGDFTWGNKVLRRFQWNVSLS
jgi:prepilin-type N-terminal cleavage/methylation domain-containing protein